MTYYFVYETTNLINNKKYIGYHKTENLNDGYIGSGKILVNAIKKYGVNNFNRKILKFFNNSKSALEYEKNLITEELIKSNLYYNVMPGGQGGDANGKFSRNYGVKKSEEHKRKLSSARVGKFVGEKNPFYGKKHTETTRKLLSDRQKGEMSAVYDTTVYQFINHNTGDIFSGTQYQFRTKFNLDSGNVNRLIKSNIQSYKGWTLEGNIIPKKGPIPENKNYKIIKKDEIFFGTRKEIMEKLKTKDVSRFLAGKTKICKGWKLYE